MKTESFSLDTLDAIAGTELSWTFSIDADAFVGKSTVAKSETASVTQITKEQLSSIDARLPILFENVLKMKVDDKAKGRLISGSVRFWVNANPMPFGKPFFTNHFVDTVESINMYDVEAKKIDLRAICLEVVEVNGVLTAKKRQVFTSTVTFDDVLPYYPGFQERIAVAESLSMNASEKAAFVFPQSHEKPEASNSGIKPDLPTF